jgi:pimeloyl-ACP methyl ester carboxylesterase
MDTFETVRSADGTTIAYQKTGSGPAVVLIGGAFNDRSTTVALAEQLAPGFTAYSYDRRGRGDSGDTPPFAVDREIEDLAAVMAAAAADTGGPVSLFGHSSGAVLALEATARGLPVERLAVYESPFAVDDLRPVPGDDIGDRLSALVAEGRRTDAVRLFLTESVGVPDAVVDGMRSGPGWSGMEAIAHTLPYDAALFEPGLRVPTERYATIAVPVLAVDGTDSPPWMRASVAAVAKAIPGAEHVSLDGQDHGILHGPAPLVPVLERFLAG